MMRSRPSSLRRFPAIVFMILLLLPVTPVLASGRTHSFHFRKLIIRSVSVGSPRAGGYEDRAARLPLLWSPSLSLGMTAIRIVGSFQAQGLPPVSPAQEDVVRVVGAPAGPRRSGDVLEQKSREVSSLLRCPVCQGLAISDSPSTMARDMKMQVHDLLAAGYSEEQIMRYFENSYGEFVRLKPSLRGMNWLVWFAPLLILLAGAAIVVGMVRRHPARSVDGAAGAEGLVENDLEPYLRRVRELAYGRAEGVLPEEAAVTPVSGPRT